MAQLIYIFSLKLGPHLYIIFINLCAIYFISYFINKWHNEYKWRDRCPINMLIYFFIINDRASRMKYIGLADGPETNKNESFCPFKLKGVWIDFCFLRPHSQKSR